MPGKVEPLWIVAPGRTGVARGAIAGACGIAAADEPSWTDCGAGALDVRWIAAPGSTDVWFVLGEACGATVGEPPWTVDVGVLGVRCVVGSCGALGDACATTWACGVAGLEAVSGVSRTGSLVVRWTVAPGSTGLLDSATAWGREFAVVGESSWTVGVGSLGVRWIAAAGSTGVRGVRRAACATACGVAALGAGEPPWTVGAGPPGLRWIVAAGSTGVRGDAALGELLRAVGAWPWGVRWIMGPGSADDWLALGPACATVWACGGVALGMAGAVLRDV
ncbi:hypothetical protein Aglo01_38430 [Actinokineospora globicatena]|nr:hypothetical protein Aglo01_38430 [Actinokineospora globicatena]GLW86229.1 hypothetical protein Aglo02_38680 [Actinokineospora globicatena]